MANTTVTLNPGSGGANVAFWLDAASANHQYVVMETRTGAADPVPVGTANPLPVTFGTSVPVVGNVGSGTADSGFGVKVSGVYNGNTPTFVTGQRADFQTDVNGNLLVNIAAGAAAGGTSSTFSASFPGSGTAIGMLNSAGTLMVPLAADASGNLKVNIASGSVQAVTDNISTFTAGSTQGLAIAGVYNDSLGTLTSGTLGIGRLTQNRQMRAVIDTDPTAIGGLTPAKIVSAASTNATSLKASPGRLGALIVGNQGATVAWLKLYNKASAPTVGTDTPVQSILIPGNTAGAGFAYPLPPQGLGFSTGIAYAITGGAADNDTTAVAAAQVNANFGYG
jgi:hypothetical protein